jgi:hypothetical protein
MEKIARRQSRKDEQHAPQEAEIETPAVVSDDSPAVSPQE